MFQLSEEEKEKVVANCDHLSKLKYSSTLPFAFTDHGAIIRALKELAEPEPVPKKRRIGY
jgi:hypothetical protein